MLKPLGNCYSFVVSLYTSHKLSHDTVSSEIPASGNEYFSIRRGSPTAPHSRYLNVCQLIPVISVVIVPINVSQEPPLVTPFRFCASKEINEVLS